MAETYVTFTLGTDDFTITDWDGTDFQFEKESNNPTPYYLDDVTDAVSLKALIDKVEESHPNSQPTPRPKP